MVDVDGRFKYSEIVTANSNCKEKLVTLYPNPTVDKFYINLSGYNSAAQIKLYNIEGKLMANYKLNNGNHVIATNELPSGLYSVVILDNNGNAIVKKLNIIK